MRLTVSMPCYGRPQRTIRAIESICNQNINGWEALIVGDGCPVMESFIKEGTFNAFIEQAARNGNVLSITNNAEHKGGCGYDIINTNIQRAKGDYFIFMSNDDVIKPNHFANYLDGIENTDLDFVYLNTFVEPYGTIRNADLSFGNIGHSELIIRTPFLRAMPPHSSNYGHDWELVSNMMHAGGNSRKKYDGSEPTYIVKSVPTKQEPEID